MATPKKDLMIWKGDKGKMEIDFYLNHNHNCQFLVSLAIS